MLLWATVKPFRVSLVEPVAYLSDSYPWTRVLADELDIETIITGTLTASRNSRILLN